VNVLAKLQLLTVLDQLARDVEQDRDVLLQRWEKRVEGLVSVGVPLADAESAAYHALVTAEHRDAEYRKAARRRDPA
jgi:hypothetical protein